MRILLSMLVLLALTSCVSAPPPPPARREAPLPPVVALPPPAPLASDWRDWPQTPGDWDYRNAGGGHNATFGTEDPGEFTIWCNADRRVRLSRIGIGAGPMTIRTTSMTRALPTQAAGGPGNVGTAILSPNDPILDAIAFSRGRFVVEAPGTRPAVLPAWAEVERVIEDCRG